MNSRIKLLLDGETVVQRGSHIITSACEHASYLQNENSTIVVVLLLWNTLRKKEQTNTDIIERRTITASTAQGVTKHLRL